MITWTGEMAFSGTTPSGHKIKMDAAEDVGGKIMEQDPLSYFCILLQGAQVLIL